MIEPPEIAAVAALLRLMPLVVPAPLAEIVPPAIVRAPDAISIALELPELVRLSVSSPLLIVTLAVAVAFSAAAATETIEVPLEVMVGEELVVPIVSVEAASSETIFVPVPLIVPPLMLAVAPVKSIIFPLWVIEPLDKVKVEPAAAVINAADVPVLAPLVMALFSLSPTIVNEPGVAAVSPSAAEPIWKAVPVDETLEEKV